MTTTLQVSLLCRPSLSPSIRTFHLSLSALPRSTFFLSYSSLSVSYKSRFCRHRLLLHSTLHPDSVNSNSTSESTLSNNKDLISSDFEESQVTHLINEPEVSELEPKIEAGIKTENLGVERDDSKSKLPILVFLMGLFGTLRNKFEKVVLSDWFNWWPFWRQEKRLELLIAEADANPKDAAKQSALFAELNKQK